MCPINVAIYIFFICNVDRSSFYWNDLMCRQILPLHQIGQSCSLLIVDLHYWACNGTRAITLQSNQLVQTYSSLIVELC